MFYAVRIFPGHWCSSNNHVLSFLRRSAYSRSPHTEEAREDRRKVFAFSDEDGYLKQHWPDRKALSKQAAHAYPHKGLVFTVIAGVIVFVINEGKIPEMFKVFNFMTSTQSTRSDNIATSTLNISDILLKRNTLNTSYEQQNFLKNYYGKEVFGSGSFINFSGFGERFFVIVDISTDNIACVLTDSSGNSDLAAKLLLLKKGQKFTFSGIFTEGALNGIYQEVNNCVWLQ